MFGGVELVENEIPYLSCKRKPVVAQGRAKWSWICGEILCKAVKQREWARAKEIEWEKERECQRERKEKSRQTNTNHRLIDEHRCVFKPYPYWQYTLKKKYLCGEKESLSIFLFFHVVVQRSIKPKALPVLVVMGKWVRAGGWVLQRFAGGVCSSPQCGCFTSFHISWSWLSLRLLCQKPGHDLPSHTTSTTAELQLTNSHQRVRCRQRPTDRHEGKRQKDQIAQILISEWFPGNTNVHEQKMTNVLRLDNRKP